MKFKEASKRGSRSRKSVRDRGNEPPYSVYRAARPINGGDQPYWWRELAIRANVEPFDTWLNGNRGFFLATTAITLTTATSRGRGNRASRGSVLTSFSFVLPIARTRRLIRRIASFSISLFARKRVSVKIIVSW